MSEIFGPEAGGDSGNPFPPDIVPPVDFSGTLDANPADGGRPDQSDPDAGTWAITAPDDAEEDRPVQAGSEAVPGGEDGRPVAVTEVRERLLADEAAQVAPAEATEDRERVDERAYLFKGVPGVTREEILDRRTQWEGEQPVRSRPVATGIVLPTDEEVAAVSGPAFAETPFTMINSNNPLWDKTTSLSASFMKLVEADMERNGIAGRPRPTTSAGNFTEPNRQPFHSENLASASVFWTVAVGVGATIGANGIVSISDTNFRGDLEEHVEVGLGKQLEEVTFPVGTVVRLMGQGDVHASPRGNGGRIFMTAVLHDPRSIRG